MTRLEKLIAALENYSDMFCYYDEELEDTVIDGSEEEVYSVIMRDEELHLLGTETVRAWIHLWYTDWESYVVKARNCKKGGGI